MKNINVLPPEVANKIAAGEVVERPAAAVKELIENAIDAGADKITIEIKDGGISYIRVTDNGSGMNSENAVKAFLRHATSKVTVAEDLTNVCTLGFRGEALASIAAVSDVELITKMSDDTGVNLILTAGKIVKNEAIGCPDGTTIAVRRLFYNVPARMKFLKKNSTEGSYITDVVSRLVLANPGISFKYISDGKEKLFHMGDGELKTAIYSVYGREYADNILPLSRSQNGITVSGYVGKPEVSRSNRAYQSLFVNGRYVINKNISYRIEQAFEGSLMTHRFPFYAINITLPPGNVDVNVHPTKQEVKFMDERGVANEVYWAVKTALAQDADTIRNEIKPKAEFKVPVAAQPVEKPQQLRFNYQYAPLVPAKSQQHKQHETAQILRSPVPVSVLQRPVTEKPDNSYRIVGQLFNTYIIIELKNSLVLIDQHAAHERLIYERLLKKEDTGMSQLLISPEVITLLPKEFAAVFEYKDKLVELGFDFEDFGSNSLLLRAVPDGVDSASAKDLILELTEKFEKGDFDTKDKEALHMIACKAALKGNSRLDTSEIDKLVQELLETGGINTCPHGRPIMISYTKYEIEKIFKRIQ